MFHPPVPAADALKERHRAIRNGHPEALRLRVHRALSWLRRAEQCDDDDGRFIFLWIAFNAAYAQEKNSSDHTNPSERALFNQFLDRLCHLDAQQHISTLVWHEFSGPIRSLLDTEFVFQAFWDYKRGVMSADDWQRYFDKEKSAAHKALAQGNTARLLEIIFSRLYVLRNQIMHGGATFHSSFNRQQVSDCTRLLGRLVPLIITIMMDSPDAPWEDAIYPPIG